MSAEPNAPEQQAPSEPTSPPPSRWQQRWRLALPYLPFVAFVGGFVFDSVTLGRNVSRLDLYLVTIYATLGLVATILREVATDARVLKLGAILLQFAMGGCLSAIVVLYFKSAGSPLTMALVLALFVAMVGNEWVHREAPPQREYALALWCLCTCMLGNFVVPHLIKSVSPWLFYACVAVAVAVVITLRNVFRFPWRDLRLSLGAAALLSALWTAGVVPPVPLIFKNNLVCNNFTKSDYSCDVDEPTLLQRAGLAGATVTTSSAAYCLTAVFAPAEVEVTMEHRWYRHDGGWQLTDTMTHPMRGGRKDGWRFWSRKRNIKEGLWKVETALKNGPVLGYSKFRVIHGDGPKRRTRLQSR